MPQVIDQKQKVYPSPADVPERSRVRVPEAVFPPTEAELADFHLERWYVLFSIIGDHITRGIMALEVKILAFVWALTEPS